MDAKLDEIIRTFVTKMDWQTALWFTALMPVSPRLRRPRPSYVLRDVMGNAIGHAEVTNAQKFI